MKKLFLVFLLMLTTTFPAWAAVGKLNIVTTQTIFADLVKQVGKDKVEVKAVVSP